MVQQRFKLTQRDIRKVVVNIGIFAIPLAIGFSGAIQQGLPIKQALWFVYAAFLQALLDVLKKWQAEHPEDPDPENYR